MVGQLKFQETGRLEHGRSVTAGEWAIVQRERLGLAAKCHFQLVFTISEACFTVSKGLQILATTSSHVASLFTLGGKISV